MCIRDSYRGGGSGAISLGDDSFYKLRMQYLETAKQLINEKEYEKAAFVYLKLLKDPHSAARVLEEGGLYAEAAALHLKNNDKINAARLYEKAKMYEKAIELHEELKNFEQAGDLYLKIGKQEEAMQAYNKVVEDHKKNNRYLQAEKVLLYKMGDFNGAQKLLLDGFEKEIQAQDCLNKYFSNTPTENLESAVSSLYFRKKHEHAADIFLKGVAKSYERHEFIPWAVRDIYHELLSQEIHKDHLKINLLKALYPNDKSLIKDTLKYSLQTKKEARLSGILNTLKGNELSDVEKEEETFEIVETMPRFPGCEALSTEEEKKKCANTKMLDFISQHISYPIDAWNNGVQGTVVIRFTINKLGDIIFPEIVRDIGAGCGEAALAVVKKMPKWTPGTQKGKPVSVQFNLPIQFKLQ